MAGDKHSRSQKPLRFETVRGEPYTIGDRTLTPVVGIISYGKARASIGSRRLGGWTRGFVRLTPLAILEGTPDGERRIAISDVTSATMNRMLAATVALTLLLTAIRWFVRRQRDLP